MAVITISRGSFSHGEVVAEKTAEALGYECISREVLIEISQEFNIPEVKLLKAMQNAPSALERFTFGREKYVAYIRAKILEYLAKDNIIYHGFAGHFFVMDVPHVLKVRILAEMEDRVRCMMNRETVTSRKKAQKMVRDVDEARRNWSLKLYGMDPWDARLYDLIVNIGKLTVDDTVEMIVKIAKMEKFRATRESQAVMEKLLKNARKEMKKLSAGTAPFFEPMRGTPWQK